MRKAPEADEQKRIEADAKRERDLDLACARLLRTADGQQVFGWLRQVYLHTIMPSTASDQALRQREGSREVVAVVYQRAERGERNAG